MHADGFENLADHVVVAEGRLPEAAEPGIIEVAIGAEAALATGVTVGDELLLHQEFDNCERDVPPAGFPPPPPDHPGKRVMRFPQAGLRACASALAIVLALGVTISDASAQGDLEKTPWATGMVYPVGDPQNFQLPAPGEERGFAISRGLRGGRDRHEGVDLSNRERGGTVRAVAPGLVVCTRTSHGGGWGNMVVLAHRLPGGEGLCHLGAAPR